MAEYVKFEQFVEDLGSKVHDLQASGDTLKVYLTNNTPSVSVDAVKADLGGITEQYGYAPADIQQDFSQVSGVGTLTGVDVTFTASGGDFEPFRYAVLYNETPTSPADPLVACWDYGIEITVKNGASFEVDFGSSIFTLT